MGLLECSRDGLAWYMEETPIMEEEYAMGKSSEAVKKKKKKEEGIRVWLYGV